MKLVTLPTDAQAQTHPTQHRAQQKNAGQKNTPARRIASRALAGVLALALLVATPASAFAQVAATSSPDTTSRQLAANATSSADATESTQSTSNEQEVLPSLDSNIDTSQEATIESKAEIVYALLDYSGSTQDVYVVNRFRVSAQGSFTDFGAYTNLKNLTNVEELSISNDEVALAAAQGDFYYQGTLKEAVLPWNISFVYTLDGKVVSDPATLAGQSGALGIEIATSPNEGVDQRFYEHYTLQIALTLPTQSIDNLDAEGATVATAGSNTQVNYVVLPGSEGSYKLTVDIEDIALPGISIAAVPYGMEFDIPDTSGMSNELATLTNSIALLSSSTQQVSSGLAQAATGLETLGGYSALVNTGLAGLSENTPTLTQSSTTLSENLATTASSLQQMYDAGMFDTMDATQKAQLEALLQGLTSISSGYTQLDAGLQDYAAGVQGLATLEVEVDGGLSSSVAGVRQLSNGLASVSAGSTELSNGVQTMPEEMQKQIDEFAAAYDFSGFEPASFVSDKNKNVQLVQFVFTTPAIEEPQHDEDQEETQEESSILDRLIALFTGE